MLLLRRLLPTSELELVARFVAEQRYLAVLHAERPPIPLVPGVVRAIISANRRLRHFATSN